MIERQQFFALKNIYGFAYSNRQLLELSGIDTLQQRRKAAVLKFAQKTAANKRFTEWFTMRKMSVRHKNREEFVEKPARTDRRMNSPLYHYRCVLNEHRVDYDARNKYKKTQ